MSGEGGRGGEERVGPPRAAKWFLTRFSRSSSTSKVAVPFSYSVRGDRRVVRLRLKFFSNEEHHENRDAKERHQHLWEDRLQKCYFS